MRAAANSSSSWYVIFSLEAIREIARRPISFAATNDLGVVLRAANTISLATSIRIGAKDTSSRERVAPSPAVRDPRADGSRHGSLLIDINEFTITRPGREGERPLPRDIPLESINFVDTRIGAARRTDYRIRSRSVRRTLREGHRNGTGRIRPSGNGGFIEIEIGHRYREGVDRRV